MTNPLYDRLFGANAARRTPFLHLPGGETISHADFAVMAARYANALSGAGAAPGDRIALQVEKSPEALAVVAACAQAGFIVLPLNPAYTAPETAYFVQDSGARLFIIDPARVDEMAEASGSATVVTLSGDGRGTLVDAAQDQPATFQTVPRRADDLAAFLYTSGTTGRSKGAMLSQSNLISNAETLADHWRFTDTDVLLHALPIFHTHGLFVAMNVTLIAGGAMILLAKFDVGEMLTQMPRATAMMGVPTFYTRLLDDPRFDRDLAGHMRLFISGSAPLLAETHHAFEDRTGHRILERYGMTETNMNTSNPYTGDRRAGTVGLPLPGVELRIVDGEAPVEIGETGAIEVRGPNVFQGYWNMPEKTAEELGADGWFKTGDLGMQDADGYVSIVGRAKDLIISGGFNIYPKELESLLDDQPGVLESAVIGVPHADFGEAPVALLVPRADQSPDLSAITADLRAKLARYKQPARLIVVSELPRNTMGKVQKAALRAEYADLLSG